MDQVQEIVVACLQEEIQILHQAFDQAAVATRVYTVVEKRSSDSEEVEYRVVSVLLPLDVLTAKDKALEDIRKIKAEAFDRIKEAIVLKPNASAK
jgi:hypothetical protein